MSTPLPLMITLENFKEEMFETVIKLIGLTVQAKKVNTLQKLIGKDGLYSRKGIRNVVMEPLNNNSENRIVLLNPSVYGDKVENLRLKNQDALISELGSLPQAKEMQVEIKYQNLSTHEVLSQILPPGVDVPSSFETIGHIAHLNLRKEHEPYKKIIGKVIMDKSSHIKTVINKLGNIENQFRTFPMELLAGEDNFLVVAKSHGYSYKFNFAEVYWNSRLTEEHECLVKNHIGKKDWVIDAFCGVGPFAVRAAKEKQCCVLASDLNPKSVEYLVENLNLNKVKHANGGTAQLEAGADFGWVRTFNEDARKFIVEQANYLLVNKTDGNNQKVHLIMNLPMDAPEFLDCLRGRFIIKSESEGRSKLKLFIHCYCFIVHVNKDEQSKTKEAQMRIAKALGIFDDELACRFVFENNFKMREIRDVSPGKLMVCCHFALEIVSPVKEGEEENVGAGDDDVSGKRAKVTTY